MSATRDAVDRAVLAHRADPTEVNREALMVAMAAHHEAFLREQTIDFQIRTHRSAS